MSVSAARFFATDPGFLTPEIEDSFFTDIKTLNNTFKRTAAARFRDLDDQCVRMFDRHRVRLREVLDIGISSGTTTLALHERLRASGHTPTITGTDLSLSGYLTKPLPGLRVLIDEQGHPLQYELLGRVIRPWPRRADYVTGMVLVRRLLRAVSTGRIRNLLCEKRDAIRQVRLLSPRLANRPEIAVESNDIFSSTRHFVGKFDFVRAANILNLGYFDEALLRRGFENVVSYLAGPGAWLLVARSSESGHAATLFRVSASGRELSVMQRFGAGSEVEALVLSTPLPFRPTDA